jgi:hypothetical protein
VWVGRGGFGTPVETCPRAERGNQRKRRNKGCAGGVGGWRVRCVLEWGDSVTCTSFVRGGFGRLCARPTQPPPRCVPARRHATDEKSGPSTRLETRTKESKVRVSLLLKTAIEGTGKPKGRTRRPEVGRARHAGARHHRSPRAARRARSNRTRTLGPERW